MNYDEKRLFSLDMLRGLDMIFLTVVAPLIMAVDAVWGLPKGVVHFMVTHPWEGFTAYDLIMPLFLFMCGAAIPLSLERRLEKNDGRPDAAYWKHVIWRFVMLWVLGLVVQGRLLSLNLDKIRLYDNTLQTIAAGYLVCAITVALTQKLWIKIAIPAACFTVYGVLLHALGDYSTTGNFAFKVEKTILEAIVPATSETMSELTSDTKDMLEVHYTWYLTSLMFVFMAFAGYFATKILQSQAAQWVRARRLAVYGAVMLAAGWLLALAGVRMVKHIFTVSFTAQAMGWCALLLAALYVITDIWKLRRGLGLCILFGQFALTAYLTEFFCPVMEKFAEMFVGGVPHLIGTDAYQRIFVAVFVVAETVAVLAIRRRLKQR